MRDGVGGDGLADGSCGHSVDFLLTNRGRYDIMNAVKTAILWLDSHGYDALVFLVFLACAVTAVYLLPWAVIVGVAIAFCIGVVLLAALLFCMFIWYHLVRWAER